jgi:hypothetical protein
VPFVDGITGSGMHLLGFHENGKAKCKKSEAEILIIHEKWIFSAFEKV